MYDFRHPKTSALPHEGPVVMRLCIKPRRIFAPMTPQKDKMSFGSGVIYPITRTE